MSGFSLRRMRAELARLPHAAALSGLSRGTALFRPGEPSRDVYLLEEGRVKIARSGPRGRDLVFRLVEGGELFGESSLFHEPFRRAAAEVVETATVISVPSHEILRHAERNPPFWGLIAPLLGTQVRQLEEKIESLYFLEVEQRVARLLLRWAESHERTEDGRWEIPLSQKEVAEMVGATRESASTAVNNLRRSGCIEIKRRRLIVRSLDELKKFAAPKVS